MIDRAGNSKYKALGLESKRTILVSKESKGVLRSHPCW